MAGIQDYDSKEKQEELYEWYIQEVYKHSQEEKEITDQIIKLEQELLKGMTKEARGIFSDLAKYETDKSKIVNRNTFIYAFNFAVQLCLKEFSSNRKEI